MESCQKIKFYRKKRNMTQDELAEAANLSNRKKKYWERRTGENSGSIAGASGNADSVR